MTETQKNTRQNRKTAGRALPWITGLLTVALAATGYWGYTQMKGRQALQVRAENNYRQSFHELIFHSEGLETRLDKLLVANSKPQIQKNLEEVRLQSLSAQERLNQLPLSTIPLNETKLLLGKLTDTAKTLSLKVQDNQPMTDTDWTALKDLRDQAKLVAKQINELRDLQTAGRLNWSDLDKISEARYDGDGNHPLSNNMKRINQFLAARGDRGPGAPEPAPQVKMRVMEEPVITPEQAVERARRYYGNNAYPNQVTFGTEVAGEWPSYRVQAKLKDGRDSRIDLTKNGGHITWVMSDRDVKGQKITEEQAVRLAKAYLRQHGYPDTSFSAYEEYDGRDIGLVSLVYNQDGVLIYPDVIRVRVALDNGEILGHTAIAYLKFHHRRTLPKPALSQAEALRRVTPRLKVTSTHLALIRNDEEQEILTYEVRGKIGEEEYQVFINAQDGKEERILKIQGKN